MADMTWTETRFLQCPLTPDEIQARGEQLAKAVQDLAALCDGHAVERKGMKDAEELAESHVSRLATIVSNRAEERSVVVELRANLNIGMVEEVRTDSGEIITSRAVTPQDKMHAQQALPLEEPPKPE